MSAAAPKATVDKLFTRTQRVTRKPHLVAVVEADGAIDVAAGMTAADLEATATAILKELVAPRPRRCGPIICASCAERSERLTAALALLSAPATTPANH